MHGHDVSSPKCKNLTALALSIMQRRGFATLALLTNLFFTEFQDSTRLASKVNATVKVEQDEETGVFVASWDDPQGGGITTQADSLEELYGAVREAIRCHFENRTAPRKVSLHFETDPVLQVA